MRKLNRREHIVLVNYPRNRILWLYKQSPPTRNLYLENSENPDNV